MNTNSDKPKLRILCISPLFAPRAGAEAFCGNKMVRALREAGASVTVLSSETVWFDGATDDSHIWDSVGETIDIPTPSHPNLLSSAVMASRFQTPFYARWIGRAVDAAAALHSLTPFDLVYSRSVPSVAHMAGFWCARKFGLPWIANFNDPWIFNFFLERGQSMGYAAPAGTDTAYPKLSRFETRAQHFWLRRTLQKADLITYPCKGLHDFHTSLADLDHAAEIIPHIGYRPEGPSPDPNGEFRLVHAGTLGASEVTGRSPKALLSGLNAFVKSTPDAATRAKLVFVGPEDKDTQALVCELGLQKNVQFVGRVNYEVSLGHIFSASACLLIEANMDQGIFFPSKLADYIACGKPILSLSPRNGTVADLASRGELMRVDHDPKAVQNAITRLYSEFKTGTLGSRNPSAQLQTELQASTVAKKFLTAYLSLTSKPRKRQSS
jgi:glycosyltransferase involved in cell wall biosynthesis